MRANWVDIHLNTRWNQHGQTVGGQNPSLPFPQGVFTAEDQTIYVADWLNNYIAAWREGETQGEVVAGANGQGNGAHQLNKPTDVIVDKENDSLLICDRWNDRVVRWPRQNGTHGETILSNIRCYSLNMDDEGSLYVTDTNKDEVKRYRWSESEGTVVAGGNGRGDRLDQLSNPYYLFVDREHSVFISDHNSHRVMKWTAGAKEGMVVAGGQGRGRNLSQLCLPNGVLVDQLGSVYVSDADNDRVVRWQKGAQHGTVVAGANGRGAEANQLYYPEGLSFDHYGHLYVVDRDNNRVQKFTLEVS